MTVVDKEIYHNNNTAVIKPTLERGPRLGDGRLSREGLQKGERKGAEDGRSGGRCKPLSTGVWYGPVVPGDKREWLGS